MVRARACMLRSADFPRSAREGISGLDQRQHVGANIVAVFRAEALSNPNAQC